MNESELEFKIENFEGPLDLLLSLVREHKMDLMDIDVAELASQYLKLINVLKNDNIDLAGEYLVMAATLLHLKSRMILDDPNDKSVEIEKQDLLKQLVEHHQFKMVADKLRLNEKRRGNIFIKNVEDYDRWVPDIDEARLDGKSDAIKLIIAMRKMFERTNAKNMREASVKKFNLTTAERRVQLLKIFKTKKEPTFEEIFDVPTMNHFVLTILTLLDMSRKFEIIMEQENQYEKINFKLGEALND